MPNPFTRFLKSQRPTDQQEELDRFVARWDAVEAIVVDVNKRRSALEEERIAYTAARAGLLDEYAAKWAERFAPHWAGTWEGGQPTPSDPFPRILAAESADGFVGNWAAMQALASARETLNRYILSLQE